MAKKGEKRINIKPKAEYSPELNRLLIENFVSFQKVMANLAAGLDSLTEKISKLLDLFEGAAKNFAGKNEVASRGELTRKIDSLLEQNKTFAKGIAMVYEKNLGGSAPPVPSMPSKEEAINLGGYQHSVPTEEPDNIPIQKSRKRENA